MTEQLPEATGEPGEVEVNYETDDLGIKITAVLGESSIVVEHSWGGAEEAATLTQALPQILVAVQAALEDQEDT